MKIRIRLKSCDGGYVVGTINSGSFGPIPAIMIANFYKEAIESYTPCNNTK